MGRRRFDHLVAELSEALGVWVARYDLWLAMHELGYDPELLTRDSAMAFCDGPLRRFLHTRGLHLSARSARRLRRSVGRFDPAAPSPPERAPAL